MSPHVNIGAATLHCLFACVRGCGERNKREVRGGASQNVYLCYTAVDEKLTELVTMDRHFRRAVLVGT